MIYLPDQEKWFQKIWGAWIGKIAGGTYGMPAEGKYLQKLNPPLTGWMDRHYQLINDDEQFELIALMLLEHYSDTEIIEFATKGELFQSSRLGKLWQENLHHKLIFTAEKCALENAVKHGVPWEHAGDEIYEGRYQNPYYDWIGAQMKGEIFGMLAPAWGWYDSSELSPEKDYLRLKRCLDWCYQDAWIAHREVAIIGELFIGAMISVAMAYDPMTYRCEIQYPVSSVQFTKLRVYLGQEIKGSDVSKELIKGVGISAEIIKNDIKRIKHVLLNWERVRKQDVERYFSFIDPILEFHDQNPDPRKWPEVWSIVEKIWKEYEKEMYADAQNKLGNKKEWLKIRKQALKKGPIVHTLLNNAAVVIGLLYGDGDAFQTIQRATECGLDADCNAGNAGAIIGAYLGQPLLSMYLKRFIRGEIITCLTNWHDHSLETLAQRTLKQALRLEKIN